MERLILDTSALIAPERAGDPAVALADDADIAISAITVSELLVGVELATDQHREDRRKLVEGILNRVEIIAFDLEVARHHAWLLASARRAGQPRGAHDLQIAATARASGRTVVTTDASAFDGLAGIEHRLLA